MPGWDPEGEFRALLARAAAEEKVVGVVSFGSRAAGRFVTEESDVDAFVIVDGAAEDSYRWATNHGDPVEVWPITLEAFRTHALPGDASEWNRPAFLTARVDLDRLDGEIAAIVDRKRRLTAEEAAALAARSLDGFINSAYRALRNHEGGRTLAGRLDGLASIPDLLTTAFAMENRVRPFNKWLEVELEREPLTSPSLAELVPVVDAIARDPSPEPLRQAVRMIERAARAAGHGSVVDGWEPDVAWLRGGLLPSAPLQIV